MAENTIQIEGHGSSFPSNTYQSCSGNRSESSEWLRSLGKLRHRNAENEKQGQINMEVYSSFLKHKIKSLSQAPGSPANSPAATLANLHERNTFFLERSIVKVYLNFHQCSSNVITLRMN